MPENPISTAQLANRRGFLLGITLAEIMIITLFVLLLLLTIVSMIFASNSSPILVVVVNEEISEGHEYV